MTMTLTMSMRNTVTQAGRLLSSTRVRLLGSVACLMALTACSGEDQLPIGAVLSISPPERSLNIDDRSDENGVCFINPDFFIDWPIVLALTDSAGSPIGQQNVSVYLDFAANNFSGFPVMALFDDRRGNGNGVVDDFELVSDTDDDIAVVQTDFYGGDRPLLLRINISCPFRGEVFAFIDGVSGRATIDVTVGGGTTLGVNSVESGL